VTIGRPRTLGRVLAHTVLAAIITLLGLVLTASPAQAHNYLVSSTPAAGSVLTELPAQFSVTTNGVLLDFGGDGSTAALEVKGPDGLYYGDGCVTVSGPSVSTDAAIGGPGEYTILWRVISTDGHPVSNEFTFTWQPASAAPSAGAIPSATATAPSPGSSSPPVCPGTEAAGTQPDSAGNSAPSSAVPTAASNDGSVPVFVWVIGAVAIVALAVFVTLWLLRKPAPASEDDSDSHRATLQK
jgi:methionine-rich copper-binding protein CopC